MLKAVFFILQLVQPCPVKVKIQKQFLAGVPVKTDKMNDPFTSGAVIRMWNMRGKKYCLPRTEYVMLIIDREFTGSGYTDQELPQGKSLRPVYRILFIIKAQHTDQEGNGVVQLFIYTDRVNHLFT
jgi:hypothetical protein